MSVTAPHIGTVGQALVEDRARKIVEGRHHPCVVLLGARPTWSGPENYRSDGRTVHVGTGLSQIDVLDRIVTLPPGDSLIVITDRTESELGDTVLTRVHRQRIETVDEWDSVAQLFGASEPDPGLRRYGPWVPAALLDSRPPGGWTPVTTGVLNADHALGQLLARVLGTEAEVVQNESRLLQQLNDTQSRDAWRATDEEVRKGLTDWAGQSLGGVTELALAAAAGSSAVSTIALGLALDVLWAESGQSRSSRRTAAKARIETHFGERTPGDEDARAYAQVARDVVRSVDESSGEGMRVRAQAEALLDDLGWADGATRSSTLEAGFRYRLRELATALDGEPDDRESALAGVRAHELAKHKAADMARAEMAVRLARWLDMRSTTQTRFADAVRDYAHDGGWVDRASEVVWVGSDDARLAAAYRQLLERVRERRRASDEVFARLLADAATTDAATVDRGGDGVVVGVEDLRAELITPLSTEVPVLLVVLDGMSVRVATEIAEFATSWAEIVPVQSQKRLAAVSVLPTLTTHARTSLFSGRLVTGQQADEKRNFDGPLFHKADLRAPAGHLLSAEVAEAIAGSQRRVGVVLNTIDDALAKHDPGGTRWTLEQVQHLGALLDAAHSAGRAVVLTSDHGHVVEHGDSTKSADGPDARWRTASAGVPGDGEIAVSGRRVLAGDGNVVLPWREDIRYGNVRAGYHGGAAATEVTVPVIVLAREGSSAPAGWQAASPQAPVWWNQATESHAIEVRPATRPRRTRAAAPQQETLVDVPEQPGAVDLVDALLASEVYSEQKQRAGRMALADDEVADVLRIALSQPGPVHRIHRDILAADLGLAAAELPRRLSVLKRMLNVEGYEVVRDDAAASTVVVDAGVLAEQFELSRSATR